MLTDIFEEKCEYDTNTLEQLQRVIDDNQKKIILIGGLSKLARNNLIQYVLNEDSSYKVIHQAQFSNQQEKLTTLQLLKCIEQKLKEYISNSSVIITGKFFSYKYRQKILKLIKKQHVPFYIVYINTPLNLILEEHVQQSMDIPDYKLRQLYKYIELPMNSFVINEYNKETSYTPQFHSMTAERVKDEVKIKLKSLFDYSLNAVEIYRSLYKVDYHRLTDARSKIEYLYKLPLEDMNEYIHSLDWDLILPIYKPCIDYNQNHMFHKYKLHEHMFRTADICRSYNGTLLMFIAALFHDIGKPYTLIDKGTVLHDTDIFKKDDKVTVKQGNNGLILATKVENNNLRQQLLLPTEVELDKNSHYYNHTNVGALLLYQQLALIGFNKNELDYIYQLVLNHMILSSGVTSFTTKTALSFIKRYKNIVNDIYIINKSDGEATGVCFQSVLDDNFKLINQLMKK